MNIGQVFDNLGLTETVAASYFASLLSCGQLVGLSRTSMLSQLGLSDADLEPLSRRLAQKYLFDLFKLIERETNRNDIGLLFAQQAKPGAFSALGYATMSCATIEEAVNLIPVYERIVLGFSRTRLEKGAKISRLRWQLQSNEVPPRAVLDAILGAWVGLSRWMSGTDAVLNKVCFELNEPDNLDVYQQFFQCPLEFNANCNALVFDSELLLLPLQQPDTQIHQLTRRCADDLLEQLESQESFSNKVSACLPKLLARQECSQQAVSKELALSERSLRRRLEEEGTSFRQLLLQRRQRLAEFYLDDANLALIDVALLLGFSEHSSFTRAFKDWNGITPIQWRQDAQKSVNESE